MRAELMDPGRRSLIARGVSARGAPVHPTDAPRTGVAPQALGRGRRARKTAAGNGPPCAAATTSVPPRARPASAPAHDTSGGAGVGSS